ncbi:hypothetical protein CDAR_78991 [Caerostris darwini]|uniref:Uncharacterized protein n=1 Tax=Caerostris darwini TaxID=1538125 RepID=A0AAV4Q3Y0_9ARAC|nr:hypothetical protein CDAR_78991 [Caerostris darwini]
MPCATKTEIHSTKDRTSPSNDLDIQTTSLLIIVCLQQGSDVSKRFRLALRSFISPSTRVARGRKDCYQGNSYLLSRQAHAFQPPPTQPSGHPSRNPPMTRTCLDECIR